MPRARENDDVSIVTFAKRPPLDDCDLLEYICEDGLPFLHLRFEEKPTTLNVLRRVIDVAHRGAGIRVRKLHVQEMSFLSGYDGRDFLAKDSFPPELLGSLESATITIMLQKNVYGQIRELFSSLYDAREMKHLSLSVFEHPTDAFLDSPEYRKYDDVFTSGFAPMLGIMTPTERRIMKEEADGRHAGQLLACCLMGGDPSMLSIEDTPRGMMALIAEQLEKANQLSIGGPAAYRGELQNIAPGRLELQQMNPYEALAAMDVKKELQYLQRPVWDDTVNAILERRLPGLLETLSLSCIMPLRPQTGFLEGLRHLKSLNLSFCRIGDSAFPALSRAIVNELPSLKELSLCRNDLSDSSEIGSVIGENLEYLNLSFNPRIGGPGASALFRRLPGTRLARIDLSNTRFRTPGLSFEALPHWSVPNAHLIIPNRFNDDEVASIESCMPDGGTLELDGPRQSPDAPQIDGTRSMMMMIRD